jgi:branched-chain amino acid transport system substrate-binding protein
MHGVTGAFASYAKDFLTGANAAAATVNAHGGVNGRPIKIKVLDDQSDPTKAISALTGALDSDNPPDALISGGGSSETLALLPQTTDGKLLTISDATAPRTNDPAKYPYNFGVSPSQPDELSAVAADLKAKGETKLAVIVPGDAFGDSVLAGIRTASQKAGVTIVDTERPSSAALDLSVQVQRARAAKPDAFFFDFPSSDAIARLLTARQTLGATGIPIYGGGGVSGTVVSSLVDAGAVKNCQVPAFSFTVKGVGGAYLRPLYTAFNGSKNAYTGGLGWDSVYLAALAFQRAGTDTSGGSLAKALTASPVPTDYLALFPKGTSFSGTSHFPVVTPGSLSLVPCSATVSDGLWVTG